MFKRRVDVKDFQNVLSAKFKLLINVSNMVQLLQHKMTPISPYIFIYVYIMENETKGTDGSCCYFWLSIWRQQ